MALISRELWFRASLAWQTILGQSHSNASCILVVAHNAVNQVDADGLGDFGVTLSHGILGFDF